MFSPSCAWRCGGRNVLSMTEINWISSYEVFRMGENTKMCASHCFSSTWLHLRSKLMFVEQNSVFVFNMRFKSSLSRHGLLRNERYACATAQLTSPFMAKWEISTEGVFFGMTFCWCMLWASSKIYLLFFLHHYFRMLSIKAWRLWGRGKIHWNATYFPPLYCSHRLRRSLGRTRLGRTRLGSTPLERNLPPLSILIAHVSYDVGDQNVHDQDVPLPFPSWRTVLIESQKKILIIIRGRTVWSTTYETPFGGIWLRYCL